MISNVSPGRMRVWATVMLGLGLAALSLPASAAVGEEEAGLSLQGAEAASQMQSGDAAPPTRAEAPLAVADNQGWKNSRTWNPNAYKNNNWNKNWNNNWNNNWNKNANKNWNKKNWNKKNVYVRAWKPRPYYGQFFGGVVLGSILTAAAIGIAPPAPAPGLCWYWSDPYGYRGYWDYCAPYPPY
jgi:hypothetical protein